MQDGEIVAYMIKGIKNEYIRLSKKYCNMQKHEIHLIEDMQIMGYNGEEEIELGVMVNEALNCLTELQRDVIIKIILQDKREKDVAAELSISRQAVNKTKIRAIEKLKLALNDYYE